MEFNCCVWHFNITQAESNDIDRVQKIACRIILNDNYKSYESALEQIELQTLKDRRTMLCKRFAENCLKHEKSMDMFPLNQNRNNRDSHKYQVKFARRAWLVNSAIPQMQMMLNEN